MVSNKMSSEREENLSRFMSGLLRHFPEDYGVDVKSNGWANREEIERVCINKFNWFNPSHIDYVVDNDSKGRYEMKDGWIRALSGHSIEVHIEADDSREIPSTLYHGTSPENEESIKSKGIKPMGRTQVHLSEDIETAQEVGDRHTMDGDSPVIFEVNVECIDSEIYNPQEGLFTTEEVPPDCLNVY